MALDEEQRLPLLEKTIKLIDKYGIWKVIRAVILILLFLFGMYYVQVAATKVGSIEANEQQTERIIAEHSEQMEVRKEIKPMVDNVLTNVLQATDADRAFILELHNGSSNTAGLPFVHCTMTYEINRDSIENVDEDYQNLSLSRFNFPSYLHKYKYWMGTIDEFKKVDNKMAIRMSTNGASYMVISTIETETNELGYFGFTYCNGKAPKNLKLIMAQTTSSVQKLSRLLDKAIIK